MIRRARVKDVQRIQKLINQYAEERLMLPRARSEIYDHLRDFFVAVEDDTIIGCVALHVTWEDLAEIRSLAVDHASIKKGIGRALVAACEEEARELLIPKVFTLTFVTKFFEKLGYQKVEKETLPHKVWTECIKCPFFPNCDEVAMVKSID